MAEQKVRIAVAINDKGEWYAYGTERTDDEAGKSEVTQALGGYQMDVYFIETTLEIPEAKTIVLQGYSDV